MYYSPLRYPGGKGKLAPFMKLIIQRLDICGGTYIEPFAGGAGIALELLLEDIVSQIVINDYDKAIAAFWKAIVTENNRFIDTMYNTPITIQEWKRQRLIIMNAKKYSFELGFATFFLNRTNRSGIIKAGVIGGSEQSGIWKMDARFNKDELARRIERIGQRKKDIIVYNKDATSLVKNYVRKFGNQTLIYFDPPYYDKGKQLYMNYFTLKDHQRIEQLIRDYVRCNWIVTYDDVDSITDIYSEYNIRKFDLNYSAANKRTARELMIFPNENLCPSNNELLENNIFLNFS